MLPTESAGLRSLKAIEPTKPAAPAGDTRQEALSRLNRIEIGKFLQAEVLSRFNDGSFLLKIDDTVVHASLPKEAQVGQTLELKLVANQPRPTFLLSTQSPPESDTTTLSTAARLIGSALQTVQGDDSLLAVVGKAPVIPSPLLETPEMAAALQKTLSSSGLFYESHLQEWVNGTRSLKDLQQEPQLSLKPDTAPATGNTATTGKPPSTSLVEIVNEWHDVPSAKSSAVQALTAQAEPLHTESTQLINLQLQALEQHKVIWQGELWPGQRMEWEVCEDRQHEHEDTPRSSWSSTVRFNLPELGTVSANIYLEENRVQMQIRAVREETASLLRMHGNELASALDAAGSPLDALTVKQDGQA